MEITSVNVAFLIYGEHFQPNAITDLLNILSNSTRIKGIIPIGRTRPAIATIWCIETDYEKLDDIGMATHIQTTKLRGSRLLNSTGGK
jgi:hypothetical protein